MPYIIYSRKIGTGAVQSDWTIEFATANGSVDDINTIGGPAGFTNNASSLNFSDDGTKMFVSRYNPDEVYQYTLSTPFDPATATYDSVALSVPGITENHATRFKPDGTRMFTGGEPDEIVQYDLSTPWDLNTASNQGQENFSGNFIDFRGFWITPDGTKLFIVGAVFVDIHQYTLTTPWDITTAVDDSISINIAADELAPQDIAFSPSGKQMFITGWTNDNIIQYDLSTAFDLTTATNNGIATTSIQQTPTGLAFKPDGTQAFLLYAGNDVQVFDTPSTPAPGTLLQTVLNPDAGGFGASGDSFGTDVDIDGNNIIVGTPNEDSTGGNSVSGYAYIVDASTGSVTHTIANPNEAFTQTGDQFGNAVSIDGNYAVVGAFQEDEGVAGDNSGVAYVFDVTTGGLLHTLTNPNSDGPVNEDQFGKNVAVSGTNIAVAAHRNRSDAGTVYVFNASTGLLTQTVENPNGVQAEIDNAQFGIGVDIDGNNLLVGQWSYDQPSTQAGGAAIFDATTGATLQTLVNPNPSQSLLFGSAVAIDGNYAVVGARGHSVVIGSQYSSGAVYVYDVSTGNLLHTIENPTPNTDDYFGNTFSVSIDGTNIVVGGVLDDEDGTNTGRAYVYDAVTGNLVRTISNPTASTTNFGASTGISGSTMVVGRTGGSDGGAVYTYSV